MTNRVTDIPGLAHLWVLDNLYLAGQPQMEETWTELAKRGVKKVINTRSEGEADFTSDMAKAKELGMEYVQIPVMGASGLDAEACEAISNAINEGETTMIHCGTANRVGGWLMTHLAGKQGMEFEKAIEVASNNGLSNPGFIEQAEAIVKG